MTEAPVKPRSLADPRAVAARRRLLGLPHIEPLTRYTSSLRAQGRGTVPHFDPLDGGIEARALFLLEKPGPMTDDGRLGRIGSGFISRDNDDSSAETLFRFMQEAHIPRRSSVLWNVVPWWNGTRRIRRSELHDGIAEVGRLIDLLPQLEAIMLVGRKAARAAPLFESSRIAVFSSAHPSPIVRATRPEMWRSIPSTWAKLAPLIHR